VGGVRGRYFLVAFVVSVRISMHPGIGRGVVASLIRNPTSRMIAPGRIAFRLRCCVCSRGRHAWRGTPPRTLTTPLTAITIHGLAGRVFSAFRGCSSVVERLLPKQDIVGSNPITRSI
jgi:hypothetical protein